MLKLESRFLKILNVFFLLCVDIEKKSECIVQEKGDNIITEPAESVEAGPSSAAVEQSDSEGGLMEEEDSRCKAPLLKRKQASETCGSKAKKTAAREEQTESSGEETESSEEMEDCVTDSQPLTDSPLASASQLDGMYSVHSIQVFLKRTKNMKNVQYDKYFADKKMLLLSVKSQMNIRGEGGFTEKEYYRLKKIGQRLAKVQAMLKMQRVYKALCLLSLITSA